MKEKVTNDNGKVFDGIEIKDTFIFPNKAGHITIKQSMGFDDEDDVIMVIPITQVESVVKALRMAKKEIQG